MSSNNSESNGGGSKDNFMGQSIVIPVPVFMTIFGVYTIYSFMQRNQKFLTNDTKKDQVANTEHKNILKTTSSNESLLNLKNDGPKQAVSSPRYRIDQETNKRSSSEFSHRPLIWRQHATWHLPAAERVKPVEIQRYVEFTNTYAAHCVSILKQYDVDVVNGFLPKEDPLQRLSYARYHVWEDLADDLPKLLGARLGQARSPLRELPVLSTDKLMTTSELRRAHLLLCLFAHAYIWGGQTPLDHIPEGIAIPLCEVSNRLKIPPVLGHPSIVLYNWRRLDTQGEICMENLCTLNNFFDGRDESWFYLITVEIEAKGAKAILPTMLAMDAINRFYEEINYRKGSNKTIPLTTTPTPETIQEYMVMERSMNIQDEYNDNQNKDDNERNNLLFVNEELIGELSKERVILFVTYQLLVVANAIQEMTNSCIAMREGCLPYIFYHRVRPFLSGWKHNPTMPEGVTYYGVNNNERQQHFGGSAAQSALLPFLDITLNINHAAASAKATPNKNNSDFLMSMRDYMLLPHREFLTYLGTHNQNVRDFVLEMIRDLPENYQPVNTSHIDVNSISATEYSLSSNLYFDILFYLREAYDNAVNNLKKFRNGHMALVHEYILQQQNPQQGKTKSDAGNEDTTATTSSTNQNLAGTAGGKGTGGTDLMNFLKPIRDNCQNSLLGRKKPSSTSTTTNTVPSMDSNKESLASLELPAESFGIVNSKEKNTSKKVYYKDNGSVDDIDLYRPSISEPNDDYHLVQNK